MAVHEIPAELRSVPFTRAQARATGLTPKTLRGARFRSMGRGLYVTAETSASYELQVRAALLVLPAATVATGVTGLRLHGVEIGAQLPLRFVTTHRHPVRRRGVQVSRSHVLPPHRGFVASPEHCWLIAARELNLLELVIAGDWLVRLGRTKLSQLGSYVHQAVGRDCVRARTAVELVRERVDSVRETRLRLCLVLTGLPSPECNVTIGDNDRPFGRVDLVYFEYKVLLEYEGDQHRTDRDQWNRDIDRYEDFTAAGWVVIRITSARLHRPRDVVARVFSALQKAGYSGPAPVFDARWSSLFE